MIITQLTLGAETKRSNGSYGSDGRSAFVQVAVHPGDDFSVVLTAAQDALAQAMAPAPVQATVPLSVRPATPSISSVVQTVVPDVVLPTGSQIRHTIAPKAKTKPAAPRLDPDVVAVALVKLPYRTTAENVRLDLAVLLGLLPDNAARGKALSTAWTELKLFGVPVVIDGLAAIPPATGCLIYANLRDRLARFAGALPVPPAVTPPASEPKKASKAPLDPKAVATAAAASGESVDDFLSALEGGAK